MSNFEIASVPKLSTESSSVTSSPNTISVPHCWQRCTFGTTVYYISPSGRVLLDHNELYYYLSSKHTCKCYLSPVLKMKYLDAFNFDANVKSIKSGESGESDWQAEPSECQSWAKKSDNHILNEQIQQTLAYLISFSISSLEEAMTVMNRTQQVDHLKTYKWMEVFDWENISIMKDGRKVIKFLSLDHLTHLTKELVMTGQLLRSVEWKTLSSKVVQEDDKENEELYIKSSK